MRMSPANEPQEYCFHLNGSIDPLMVQKTVSMMAKVSERQALTPSVHLLMHTRGGSITDGICLYNLFKMLPFDLTVYNVGGIQSIGVIAFLGAKRRIVNPNATFLIHRASISPQAANGKRLQSLAESISIDDANIESILREHLQISDDLWRRLDHEDLFISAAQAVEYGIAHEIGAYSAPRGSSIYSIA